MSFPNRSAQFRPGLSGNPAGRPKGSRNAAAVFYEMVREEWYMSDLSMPEPEFCREWLKEHRPKKITRGTARKVLRAYDRLHGCTPEMEAEAEELLEETEILVVVGEKV